MNIPPQYRRAPKEVLARIATALNGRSTYHPAGLRYTANLGDSVGDGTFRRPRAVVDREGNAYLLLHRGVRSGGKKALAGDGSFSQWKDKALAKGVPTSTHLDVARKFAGDRKRGFFKVNPMEPSRKSRGRPTFARIRRNVGTYLLPESEIGKSWVSPMRAWGPEWEVRHPDVGPFLKRIRKLHARIDAALEFGSVLRQGS